MPKRVRVRIRGRRYNMLVPWREIVEWAKLSRDLPRELRNLSIPRPHPKAVITAEDLRAVIEKGAELLEK